MSLRRLTPAEYFAYIEDHGHKLTREPDGSVDTWRLDYEHHNGPGCEKCSDTWCEHCRDSVSMCDGGEELIKEKLSPFITGEKIPVMAPDFSLIPIGTNIAAGQFSCVFGSNNHSKHTGAILIGNGLVSDSDYQIKIGNGDKFIQWECSPEDYAVFRAAIFLAMGWQDRFPPPYPPKKD